MIRVTNGTQTFWVKNPEKIKYWTELAKLSQASGHGYIRVVKKV